MSWSPAPSDATLPDAPLRGPERPVFCGSTRRSLCVRMTSLGLLLVVVLAASFVVVALRPGPLGRGLSSRERPEHTATLLREVADHGRPAHL